MSFRLRRHSMWTFERYSMWTLGIIPSHREEVLGDEKLPSVGNF